MIIIPLPLSLWVSATFPFLTARTKPGEVCEKAARKRREKGAMSKIGSHALNSCIDEMDSCRNVSTSFLFSLCKIVTGSENCNLITCLMVENLICPILGSCDNFAINEKY